LGGKFIQLGIGGGGRFGAGGTAQDDGVFHAVLPQSQIGLDEFAQYADGAGVVPVKELLVIVCF